MDRLHFGPRNDKLIGRGRYRAPIDSNTTSLASKRAEVRKSARFVTSNVHEKKVICCGFAADKHAKGGRLALGSLVWPLTHPRHRPLSLSLSWSLHCDFPLSWKDLVY